MDMFATVVALALLGAVALLLRQTHDNKEPPLVPQTIPLIGHAIQLLSGPVQYYAKLAGANHSTMFTLKLGGFMKLYVANSPAWVGPIQRSAKTLAFTPFEKVFAAAAGRASKSTLELYDRGGKYPGTGTWVKELDKIHYDALLPGPGLDWINLHTARSLTKLFLEVDLAHPTDLYAWLRHVITLATCDGVYGPSDPLRHADCEKAYWTFYYNMGSVTAGVPLIFLPRVRRAMKVLERRWHEWLEAGGVEQASPLVQGRVEHYRAAGVSISELSRLEWTQVVALVHNTVPTCWWVLFEILTRPELLAEIREEVAKAVTKDVASDGLIKLTLDATKLRTACPLLLSVLQETQRMRSITTTIRQVMADTAISPSSNHDDQDAYVLKKGNYVQFPTPLLHHNPALWGPDANAFDPHRFYRTNDSGKAKVPPNGLLPWGFAPHICPARQYATNQIFIVIAMTLLRFDVMPIAENSLAPGIWPKDPEVNTSRLSTLQPPMKDVRVNFVPRQGWQGDWSVELGSSLTRIPLVTP